MFVANYYRDMLRLPEIASVFVSMEKRKVRGCVLHRFSRARAFDPGVGSRRGLNTRWRCVGGQVTHKWHNGAMNLTLDEPTKTPVYYNENNPYNNLNSENGRPWCFRRAVITGAQVSSLPFLRPPQ